MASEIMLDQNLPFILIFAGALVLLFTSYSLGKLSRVGKLEDDSNSIESLDKQKVDEQNQIEKLRLEKEGVFKEALRAENAINEWANLKDDHQQISKMRQELDEFEREESQRIDSLELKRVEAAQRLREIQTTLDQYPEEITSDESLWRELISKRKEEFDSLQEQIEDSQKELEDLISKCTHNSQESARLESEIENLQKERDKVKNDLESRATEIKALEAVSNATISFPEEFLSVKIKEMPTDDPAGHSHDDVEKLSAFNSMPECLSRYDSERKIVDEENLLNDFEKALFEDGLIYPRRMIRAFHTALKVNDLSPLTVLSGLSGTGKSQLPRAYANFFGIHFLHVPVEPGWDSPQDILGFYDFVAERYRPTDRARALGHFDRKFREDIGIENSDRNWENRMLIILLDEMNLARTEYYFSEFLSRLEMRGKRQFNGSNSQNEDAQIAIDLPYAKDQRPKHLYIPHNVLWIGTLNEDETTQTLSDKVLDRANSIRFAPPDPEKLREHITAPKGNIIPADGYLPYRQWLYWSEPKNTSARKNQDDINRVLGELATTMQEADRGFGYRIAQSISAYINRYPGDDYRPPMVDQINMRLLPKLAGVELSKCHHTLSTLKMLSEVELNDPNFKEALEEAESNSGETEIFTWNGFSYPVNQQ